MWENGKKILCSKLLKPWSQTTPEIYPTAGYVTNRSMERHIKMFAGEGGSTPHSGPGSRPTPFTEPVNLTQAQSSTPT